MIENGERDDNSEARGRKSPVLETASRATTLADGTGITAREDACSIEGSGRRECD
jgi:hypothetical protein